MADSENFSVERRSVARSANLGQSHPPGRVIELRGIIFQSDNYSFIGAWLIRPVQTLDRWLAGLRQSTFGPPLAMHVGLHVIIEGGREFVVEQLFGTPWHAFVDGVNWTPPEVFRARDRGEDRLAAPVCRCPWATAPVSPNEIAGSEMKIASDKIGWKR
jgi:hypothetical protein